MSKEFITRARRQGSQLVKHARAIEVIGHLGRAVHPDFGNTLENALTAAKKIKTPQAQQDVAEPAPASTKLDIAIRVTEATLAAMHLARVIYQARKSRRTALSTRPTETNTD